ncbi:hypothetical protein Pan216_33140 [Planctomycetes bacterium Pan216]|uniref:3-keto-alpha-glucoside-1,2-lyase/3-keto-2-hydroxy-glucal hydratase domain-containing protein n=2 Tax=Kolteria novifilia TaxID=2527975 RepID=A0A518B646_9BACT|nr:hypothetical protein Pan216_33140 [Planctomycetes bacterium Pan216]
MLFPILTTAVVLVSAPLTRGGETSEATKAKLKKDGFVELFDGKSLSGWDSVENPNVWSVTPEGAIKGDGPRSHLFSPKEYTDFHYRADVKINHGGNSGMYFRTKKEGGWPTGYEAQVNNTHKDPKKTGSLYNIKNVTEQQIPDDTWWVQEVIAKGNRIIIKVNGKTVVDHVDPEKRHSKGHFALQQHHPGSVVQYKNVMVKDLAKDKN